MRQKCRGISKSESENIYKTYILAILIPIYVDILASYNNNNNKSRPYLIISNHANQSYVSSGFFLGTSEPEEFSSTHPVTMIFKLNQTGIL